MDTYDKRCQLGASRRRLEDAQALHSHKRWTGAIYLGGPPPRVYGVAELYLYGLGMVRPDSDSNLGGNFRNVVEVTGVSHFSEFFSFILDNKTVNLLINTRLVQFL